VRSFSFRKQVLSAAPHQLRSVKHDASRALPRLWHHDAPARYVSAPVNVEMREMPWVVLALLRNGPASNSWPPRLIAVQQAAAADRAQLGVNEPW